MSIGWALNCTVALQYGRIAYIQYNLAGQQFTVVVLALVATSHMDWNASPHFTIKRLHPGTRKIPWWPKTSKNSNINHRNGLIYRPLQYYQNRVLHLNKILFVVTHSLALCSGKQNRSWNNISVPRSSSDNHPFGVPCVLGHPRIDPTNYCGNFRLAPQRFYQRRRKLLFECSNPPS